jgi:hypothetical protein
MTKFCSCLTAILLSVIIYAQEKLDMDMLNKIRKEGLENSHVMDIAFHLTDASGPRLTSSPGFFRAANWAKDEMKAWDYLTHNWNIGANLEKDGNCKKVMWP